MLSFFGEDGIGSLTVMPVSSYCVGFMSDISSDSDNDIKVLIGFTSSLSYQIERAKAPPPTQSPSLETAALL